MDSTVVWFKRDLRLEDHASLAQALSTGKVLCLYILEPSLWRQPDYSRRQYEFLRECLRTLALALRQKNLRLELAVGEVCDVLSRLHALQPFRRLYAHEETGNAHTYARDRQVARWCKANDVIWQQWQQHGVVRRLTSRDSWQAQWTQHMHAPRIALPTPDSQQGLRLPWRDKWPDACQLGLEDDDAPLRQRGGRDSAWALLQSFLHERSETYRRGISSPALAQDACSRLSPYLSLGCLSMREVVQATMQQQAMLRDTGGPIARSKGLAAFLSRLYWHCHFIQKLESEPAIEFNNMHRGYDGLRESDINEARLAALKNGRTGWPIVDACVAMLRDTGWLNFRMRAMLVSVACYPLWLHWRPVGLWLARQFLDYEPGIHWSQMQMQAGTAGINTIRVYNPIKQAQDHDPGGEFVRRWLPALRPVPDHWIFEPWRMPPDLQQALGLAEPWPTPLVDLKQATRDAKSRLNERRQRPDVREARAAIVDLHGSRRVTNPQARRRQSSRTARIPVQTQYHLDF